MGSWPQILGQWGWIWKGVHSPAMSRVPARAPRRRGRLGEARGRPPYLELEEGDEDEEEACWGSSSPRKKRRSGWCSSPASSPGILRRCSGEVELQWKGRRKGSSSMAWLEREGLGESGRERVSRGVLGKWRVRADEWGRGWDVAPRLCVHDTHRGCTSGPSASVAWIVRGWVMWQGRSMCPR